MKKDYLGNRLCWCGRPRLEKASVWFRRPLEPIFEFLSYIRIATLKIAISWVGANQLTFLAPLPSSYGSVPPIWQNRLSHISKSIKMRVATWATKVKVDKGGLLVHDCNSPGDEFSSLHPLSLSRSSSGSENQWTKVLISINIVIIEFRPDVSGWRRQMEANRFFPRYTCSPPIP